MKKVFVICIIIIFIILAVITYLHISRKADEARQVDEAVNQVQELEKEENVTQEKELEDGEETFYAQIESIDLETNRITINQIENNVVKRNTNYTIMLTDDIPLHKSGNNIELSDLQVNDKLLITYDGIILTTNPPSLSRVKAIELLEDR